MISIKIQSVHAREILDSRGNPTVETDVVLENGVVGRASVPSGASTGAHEAHELRDENTKRYGGKEVSLAVANVNGEIAKALAGLDIRDQERIDETLIALDGTENKDRLGANAILSASLAASHAGANALGVPLFNYIRSLSGNRREPLLPTPMCNIINGGRHAAFSTDIQEFMIVPIGLHTFSEALRAMTEVFHSLEKIIAEKGYATTVGDEGGFAPRVAGGNAEAIERILSAIENAGYRSGEDISLSLDVAASELCKNGTYRLAREGKEFSSDEMIEWLKDLREKYPIVSIEDGLSEDDWTGWQKLNRTLGGDTQLVGDDIFVTNTKFLERGIREKAANAILIKVNQIGTLTETLRAVKMAEQAGWGAIISHRSGETEDTTISHLAVGLSTGQIKTGSVSRGERTAKYNELLRIEELLGDKAVFAGGSVFKR